MGLDIKVAATAGEVKEELEYWEDSLQKNEALRILEKFNDDDVIRSAPGSYHGLHVVRSEYAKLKGWPLDGNGRYILPGLASASHLINHSDCEGYYLPADFKDPQWLATDASHRISVGSSDRLLKEIMELLAVKDKWPEHFQFRWDAVFIAAVSSVACRAMITFH